MTNLDSIYRRSPLYMQNLMATGYGLKERMLRYGGEYRKFVREIEAAQWWPLDRLQILQSNRLRAMIEFCFEEVPYYQELFRSLRLRPADFQSPADLVQLPILEKETVRAQVENFVPRTGRERLIPQTTGGTTGKPLRYYVTPSAMQYNYAMYEVRFRNWAGVKFGDRMASINGKPIVPIENQKPPFWRYNLAFNQLYLSPYHLSTRNLPHYIDQLQKYRADVIVGYVSTVHTLARYILDNHLAGMICPKAILVSSETLFDWLRADIEEAFRCKVHNGYSLGELVSFISECEHGSLHISPEYGVVEAVEIEGKYEIIGTGLFNYGMPLLRYRTGDLVDLATDQTCPCGRRLPLVKAILGRIDDQVVTPEGVMVGPAPLSLAFQSVSGLKEAQIIQDKPSNIIVYLAVSDTFGSSNEQFLLGELRKRLGQSIKIEFAYVPKVARTVAGKQRLIISKCLKRSVQQALMPPDA
jgi:phenylacetate-CoA ligase